MSRFSEYLRKYIDASGESLLSISRSTGIERTGLQRALKGEKILSNEAAHALVVHLQLSLEERREYFRLYNMLLHGEDMWYNQTAVCELLNHLSGLHFPSDSSNQSSLNTNESFTLPFEYALVEGEYPVRNIISSILSWEITQNREPHFKMFLPFEMDFTSILLKLWNSGAFFTTEHLFCFPASDDGDCTKSVKILKQIIPMCLTARDYYHPYYFYERPEALFVNPLSHYIITPNHLILLSDDLSRALVHHSEKLISYYSNHFSGLMSYCEPFVFLSNSIQDIMYRARSLYDTQCHFYIMPQPCFGYSTTAEMLSKYFKAQGFPPEALGNIIEHFSDYRAMANYTIVFSEEGLQTFIDEGTIIEYPSSFASNLDVSDRIIFMEDLRKNISSDRIIGRISRPSVLSIPDYLTVYIDKNGHILCDTTRDFVHDAYYCSIHITEKSICRAFLDFSNSIAESQLVYSKEETLNILDEGIDMLKGMISKTN